MSRTIRLTRIHALNWYGYQDSIPIEGNALLAGVTGSGKSILMDLIQLVLVGDQRMVRFNQSATGDRSDRSLKGYCLGDTKQEENGLIQYMRSSAVTYIALEFTWPKGNKVETWGLRVEFVSPAEAHGKVTPFFVPTVLQRSDFLDPDRRCLDYASFKHLCESQNGRLYAEGLESYLRDMAQPTHLNFDRGVLRALLPTSMSFTFLRSFNEFCRNFILPADRLDVSDVTASYRTFLAYERDLNLLNDQFQRLNGIRGTFTHFAKLRRDQAVAAYLQAQLRHEHAAEESAVSQQALEGLRRACAEEESELKQLEQSIPEIERRMDGIKAAINETPEGRLYSELKGRNETLVREIAQLSQIGTTLEEALKLRLRNARRWLERLRGLSLDFDPGAASSVERAIVLIESGGLKSASEGLNVLKRAAERAIMEATRSAAPFAERLRDVRRQLGQLREEIAALEIGRLPFPTKLLDALNKSMAAQPLCKLCEVIDERWRAAVEVAFTRKFAVVVPQEHYDRAEKVYEQLKAIELGPDAGRESLINPAKALKCRKPIQPDSLAAKLTTSHPVAEALVSHLFGDLICVEKRELLREHEYAILPDGFMSRGAFVERRRFYDGLPFVGERGLAQQREWKQKRVLELEVEERRLRPLQEDIQGLNEDYREQFEVSHDLYADLARTLELPRKRAELEDNISKLREIDRAKFDQLAQTQGNLERDLNEMRNRRRALDRSEKRLRLSDKEREVLILREREQKLAQAFASVVNETDISLWLKRIEEMRQETLTLFPNKEVAADHLRDQLHTFQKEATGLWERLKAQRRELATAHPRFQDLASEAADNDAFDKQFAKLEQSEIPEYRDKAERERRNWESLFRTQVLEKLHTALSEVLNHLSLLNNSLKTPIGNNRYRISYRQNPDFKVYHDLITASQLARQEELFFASAEPRFRDAIERFLKILIEQPDSAEAMRLLDYRQYYDYDMLVEDVTQPDASASSVDRHSGKFSGGENQSPYFIAILASYLRAYRRYSTRKQEPALGLVPIDEAFSKLSGERIKDCITGLKSLDLQGVFSMSTGNIPYAFEHCDWLVVISKQERRVGKRTDVRNVPVSLARDSEDARRLMRA